MYIVECVNLCKSISKQSNYIAKALTFSFVILKSGKLRMAKHRKIRTDFLNKVFKA